MLIAQRDIPLRRHRILRQFQPRKTVGDRIIHPSMSSNSTSSSGVISQGHGDHTPGDWVSGRNLDLCLLAVCSCVLSLMCHHYGGVANVSSITMTTGMNAASSTPMQVDFLVKAGLLTSQRQDVDVEVEDA